MDAEKERQFWRRFHQKTIAYHVPPPARPWYRRHAEHYISTHPGLRLAAHTPDTISKYLDDLGRHGHLRDWQLRQQGSLEGMQHHPGAETPHPRIPLRFIQATQR